jgi:TAG lipase / steryl ester hydrolase / phospholipase A2 / LPA acyltransferase
MYFKKFKIRKLKKRMLKASSYSEWLEVATELDILEKNHIWQQKPESNFYHYDLIKERMDLIDTLLVNKKYEELAETIQETIYRHLGDVTTGSLYTATYSGEGKNLTKQFLDKIISTLNFICDEEISVFPAKVKLKLFKIALHNFGRTGLMLSGGGTWGIYHTGVVKALFENDLLPEIITGSSIGAVVAAAMCTKDRDELTEIFEHPENIHSNPIKFLGAGSIVSTKALLDREQLLEHCKHNCGEYTFQQAYEKTGRILNISVSPTRARQKPRILSYLTAPNVSIPHSAAVSCTIPGLFKPEKLVAIDKDGNEIPYMESERWVDGTARGDLPMARVSRLHNVNHYIVSQTNPHVLPFSKDKTGLKQFLLETTGAFAKAHGLEVLKILKDRTHSDTFRPILDQIYSMADQNYFGDITISPTFPIHYYLKIMSNPSIDEIKYYIRVGERATWPKIGMIRDQTAIGKTLEKIIKKLEKKIIEKK